MHTRTHHIANIEMFAMFEDAFTDSVFTGDIYITSTGNDKFQLGDKDHRLRFVEVFTEADAMTAEAFKARIEKGLSDAILNVPCDGADQIYATYTTRQVYSVK